MNSIPFDNISALQLNSYYVFVGIIFLFLLYKYKSSFFNQYIITLFFSGLFAFLGDSINNVYKIYLLFGAIYLLFSTKSYNIINKVKVTSFLFLIFSLLFLFSSINNDDGIVMIFSQYSRYLTIFILFLIFFNKPQLSDRQSKLFRLVYDIFLFQIIFSIAKFFLIGLTESIVGSISFKGGAIATSLPILGVLFLLIYRRGALKWKDWVFFVGLMFIGFISIKRAIWFVTPFILVLYFIVSSKKSNLLRNAMITILIVPFVFYFGVRLNPTLNQEQKVWGSFNLDYTLNYTKDYSYGESGENGRGGAFVVLLEKISASEFSLSDLFGYGLKNVYTDDVEYYSEFNQKFGIESKGSATGAFQSYIVFGLLGLLFTILYYVAILMHTKSNKFKFLLFVFVLWEYFFYTGTIFRSPPLAFLLLFIMFNSQFDYTYKRKISNPALS